MHDLSLYLLELLENSIRAGAVQVDISLLMDDQTDELRLAVDDDGPGVTGSPERILDPFYTTKAGKNTGLGLSLLKADAEAAGGGLVVRQSPTLGGIRVEAYMELSNVDRVPFGDVGKSITVTAYTNPEVQIRVNLTGDQFRPPLRAGSPAVAAERLALKPRIYPRMGSNR